MSVEAIGAYYNAMNQCQIHLIIVLLNVITRQWDENLRIWEVVGQHLKNQLFVICITGISSNVTSGLRTDNRLGWGEPHTTTAG